MGPPKPRKREGKWIGEGAVAAMDKGEPKQSMWVKRNIRIKGNDVVDGRAKIAVITEN